MSTPSLGRLSSKPAAETPELLAAPVLAALRSWAEGSWAEGSRAEGSQAEGSRAEVDGLGVTEIDPSFADTATCSEAYALPMSAGANCVVVAGKRDGEERIAACVVRADMRADVNNAVKRLLDVRKCSFLAMDRAVEESGMEYGGITPIGLPAQWRILVDSQVLDIDIAIIGSGLRRSKILLPGALIGRLPGAEVIEGLAH